MLQATEAVLREEQDRGGATRPARAVVARPAPQTDERSRPAGGMKLATLMWA
jgi:hypothetical protein